MSQMKQAQRLLKQQQDDKNKQVDKKQSSMPTYMKILDPYYKALYKNVKQFIKDDQNNPEIQTQKQLKAKEKPDYYPASMRNTNDESSNKKKEVFSNNLKFIQDPFKICVYPVSSPNIFEICDQQQIQGFEDKKKKKESYKSQACKHYHCLNCCANLKTIYKMLILKYKDQSEKFGIKVEGYWHFNNIIDLWVKIAMIEKCEEECRKAHKFDEPVLNEVKPKMTTLGLDMNTPAVHCRDIRDNNKAVKENGIFYTKPLHSLVVSKVYCNMDTEGGGWQLLFSYRHTKKQKDFVLDGTEYPLDPIYGASHTNLLQAGYSYNEISEIRFFCISSNNNKFVHFISKNSKVILSAFDEDTTQVGPLDWQSDLENINQNVLDDKFVQLFSNNVEALGSDYQRVDILKKVTKTNTDNTKGGFLTNPFGNSIGNWNIDVKKKIFECGDKAGNDKSDVLFQVWFRGRPLTKDQLKAREHNMAQMETKVEEKI